MSIFFRPKILIVGYGTVGRAVHQSLSKHYRIAVRDKKSNTIYSGKDATAAIVCVAAATRADGSIDAINVQQALKTIYDELGDIPIMVKTTLTPNYMALLPDNVVYSPEFLRQNNAYEDFQTQPFMLLGGDEKRNKFWRKVFKYLGTEFVDTTPEAASWTKYLHNAYLASKVAWFHEMDERAEAVDDKQNFYAALDIIGQHDDAIGSSHLFAPNTDSTYGYAGHCFPKDMSAFQHYLDSDLLRKIMEHNNEQRTRKPNQ